MQPRHEPVDHDGHSDGREDQVRRTGPRCDSQGPNVRLRTVRVGKTASQIMTASWCSGRPGGPGWCDMSELLNEWVSEGRGVGARDADVLLDEVVVDGDRGGGALAGSGDHLRTWVDRVPRRPDTGDAGASGAVDADPPGSSVAQPSSVSSRRAARMRGARRPPSVAPPPPTPAPRPSSGRPPRPAG